MDPINSLEAQWKKYARLTLACHKSTIHTVRWSPDGGYLASAGKDKVVHLHRATDSDLVQESRYTEKGHTADIDHLCWNPTDHRQLATASIDRHVKVWDISRIIDPTATIKLKNENVAIDWSPNGNTIAVVDAQDVVSFLDARMAYRVFRDLKFASGSRAITWNKEGDLFFVTSSDGKIHVLNDADLKTLMIIDAFSGPCDCIRFDPKGRHFAVGSHDAISSIWDAENLACVVAIDRMEWPLKTVSFSCDSKYLASGSDDRFIDIASVKTGERVTAIEVGAHTLALDFHPREYILAYALDETEYRDIGTIKVVGFPEKERRSRN